MKKLIIAVSLVLLTTTVAKAIERNQQARLVDDALSSFKTEKQFDQFMRMLAQEMAKNLPYQVDDSTTIDTVHYDPFNNALVYHYSLSTETMPDFHLYAGELLANMKDNITTKGCTTPDTRVMLDHGITTQYVYFNDLGKYIGQIEVNNKSCREGQI